MSAPWWGKERVPGSRAWMAAGVAPSAVQPVLVPLELRAILSELTARIAAFTPEWRSRRVEDAGHAVLRVFGEMTEPVVRRINRFPEKAFVEFLRVAGIAPLPATAAGALLEFQVSRGATEPTLVSEGFQVGGQPSDGGELVHFETERDLQAVPGVIQELFLQESVLFRMLDLGGPESKSSDGVLVFGKQAIAGRSLFIGIAAQENAKLAPLLSIGIGVAGPRNAPPPVSVGGIGSSIEEDSPSLRWDVYDEGQFLPTELVLDETGGLRRSGVVILRVPQRWSAGRPFGIEGSAPLFWLRLRIVHGSFSAPPRLQFVALNCVPGIAARTYRDEPLDSVPEYGDHVRRTRRAPVLPGSLILEVDGDTPDEIPARWREVPDLTSFGPDDKVYMLDPQSGEIWFGDGTHGALVPQAPESVRALRYQVGGGETGHVDAEAISVLLSSAPNIVGVRNRLAAAGGGNAETVELTLRRGPEEIRTRHRAVTVSDYSLLARQAPKADIRRAHAISGYHPSYPGTRVPGLVGVLVVPPQGVSGPPIPSQETLRSVAEYLSNKVGPLGVEIVAAAPRYRRIQAEAQVVIDPAFDTGSVVQALLEAIDTYLHPLTGGDEGVGWPFGGSLRYHVMVRRLLKLQGVRAISALSLYIDGLRVPSCQDYQLPPDALFWPDSHEVFPVRSGDSP